MAEPSTSTSASEVGGVAMALGVLTQQGEKPVLAQEPKRPEPTIPYSWADEVLAVLEPCSLGFDVEWKPVFQKGQPENKVALIQLANNEVIYLLQVSAMQKFPERLRIILEDAAYTKAGVGIQGDAMKVYRDCGVSMKSCIDLSLLARSVDSRWKGKYTNPIGLANLVATYEFLALGKGKISRSNWEAQLSPYQQEYAANDGHSGYAIYSRLINMAGEMVNPPRETYYSFDVSKGSLRDRFGLAWYPINPDYDPGPPPPPRPPKEKKEQKEQKKETQTEGDGEKQLVSSDPKQPQQPRGFHRQQAGGLNHKPYRLGEVVPGSSSGQTNRRQRPAGDKVEVNRGRGRGYAGAGPVRWTHGRGRGRGDGNRIGTFDKTGP